MGRGGAYLTGAFCRVLGWWKKIVENGSRERGRWLWGSLQKQIGDGCDTLFWSEP